MLETWRDDSEDDREVFQELILRNPGKIPVFKASPSQESDISILEEIFKFSTADDPNAPESSPVHFPNSSSTQEEFERGGSQRSSAKSLLREHCSSRTGKCKCQPEILDQRDKSGKNAVHYCAENENVNCIDQILSKDPSLVSQKDDEGYTPLHLAVISGNKVIVKYLISKGADIDAVDDELHSSVHWATVCGEVECLEILIQEGCQTATPDIHGAYPIHYSAQICGKASDAGADVRMGLVVLKRLIHYGVNVNVRDRDGRQPLMWAASSGSSDAILCLVNAGASVHVTDKDGLTPLHCAASRGHRDCVETLVGLSGADISVRDHNGCTPLFYSVTLGHPHCTRLLLDYGSYPNVQDKKGRTPSHCGAAKGQLETLKLLYALNGNLWKRNIRGDLPFHDAILSGRKDLIRWLLSQRPEAIDSSNNEGKCAMHIAAMNNNVEVCKILIDNYADVNVIMRNSKGDLLTPLDAAISKGNKGCAKYIKLHGGLSAAKLANESTLQKALSKGLSALSVEEEGKYDNDTADCPGDTLGGATLQVSADDYLQPYVQQPKGHDQALIDNDQDQLYEFSKEDEFPQVDEEIVFEPRATSASPSIIESLLKEDDEPDEDRKEEDHSKKDQKEEDHSKKDQKEEDHSKKDKKEEDHSKKDAFVEEDILEKEVLTIMDKRDSVSLDVKESGSESPITVLKLPISTNKTPNPPPPEMNPICTQTENIYSNVNRETQTSFNEECPPSPKDESKADTEQEDGDNNPGSVYSQKEDPTDSQEDPPASSPPTSPTNSRDECKNAEQISSRVPPKLEECNEEEDNDDDKSVSFREGERGSSVLDEVSDDSARINQPTMDDSGIGGERSQDEDSNLEATKFLKKKNRINPTPRVHRRLKPTGKLLRTMLEDYDGDTNHSEYYSEDEKVEDPRQGQSSSSSIHGAELRPSTVHGRSEVHSDSERNPRGSYHPHRRPVREVYRYQNKLRSYQLKPWKGSAISITQAVQMSLRKYKMERKIFQDLLELKRLQIRAGRANEHILVKRLSDNYNKSIQDLVGLKKHDGPYTFKEFEKYLYDHLRRMQESHAKLIPKVCKTQDDIERLYRALKAHGIDSTFLRHTFESCSWGAKNIHPADCTHLSHRCHHAAHAYSGIPCFRKSKQKSIILPKIDDGHTHSLLASTRIRKYDPNEPLTIELTHGTQKQCVKLPTENLEKSTKYYVTLTVDPKRTPKTLNI